MTAASLPPKLENGNVLADCPKCKARTTFEYRNVAGGTGSYGSIVLHKTNRSGSNSFPWAIYRLLACGTCSRPAVAEVWATDQNFGNAELITFWPSARPSMALPAGVPDGVRAEFEEAELAMSVSAWRGAAGLLRSALEKVLKANGYVKGSLFDKIEAAGADGVVTSSRRQRAQDLVRTLGNDVLHDEWRAVTPDEVAAAHHYVGRVIEDLYDDRSTVEAVLTAKGRLSLP